LSRPVATKGSTKIAVDGKEKASLNDPNRRILIPGPMSIENWPMSTPEIPEVAKTGSQRVSRTPVVPQGKRDRDLPRQSTRELERNGMAGNAVVASTVGAAQHFVLL
jgi:hypothetical protein